jgi:hypothetical protein
VAQAQARASASSDQLHRLHGSAAADGHRRARQQEGEDNLLQEVKQGEGEREELWKEDLANGLAFECVSYFDMYR